MLQRSCRVSFCIGAALILLLALCAPSILAGQQIEMTEFGNCAVVQNGSAICMRFDYTGMPVLLAPPSDSDPFVQLSMDSDQRSGLCALSVSGTIVCQHVPPTMPVPSDSFSVIKPMSSSTSSSAGLGILRSNGSLQAWGESAWIDAVANSGATTGPFVDAAASIGSICALNVTGHAQCWGGDYSWAGSYISVTPPDDEFVLLAASSCIHCGLTRAGDLRCWNSSSDCGANGVTVPADTFSGVVSTGAHNITQLAVSDNQNNPVVCVLLMGGSVCCFGQPTWAKATLPSLTNVVQIQLGPFSGQLCVVLGDNSTWCSDNGSAPPVSSVGGLAPQFSYRRGAVQYSCPLGRFSSGVGAINDLCSGPCLPGYFGNSSQVDTPQCSGPCPFGCSCAEYGTTQPSCLIGHYCPSATEAPVPCVAGRFASSGGDSFTCRSSPDLCTPCAAGTESNVTAATSSQTCTLCKTAFVSTAGAAVCQPCLPGRFANASSVDGVAICSRCPINTANNATAATQCTPCNAGSRALQPGASVCTPCPTDTFSPVGGECDACSSLGCQGLDSCVLGYDGDLCSECQPGYYAETVQNGPGQVLQCSACGTTPLWAYLVLLALLLLVMLLLLKLNSSALFRALLIPLSIATPHLQVLSFLSVVQLHWSSDAQQLMQLSGALAVFDARLRSLQCLVSFQTTFTFILLSPLVLAGLLALSTLLVRGCTGCSAAGGLLARCIGLKSSGNVSASSPEPWSPASSTTSLTAAANSEDSWVNPSSPVGSSGGSSRPQLWHRFRLVALEALVSYLLFAYMFLSWESLVIFDCVAIAGAAGRRVREDVTLQCGEGSYVAASLAGCALYIAGIPLLLYALLTRRSVLAAHLLGSSLKALRAECRWWIVGALLWRLAVVIALRMLLEHPPLQIALYAALLLLRAAYVSLRRPFESPLHNRQELVLSACSCTVLLIGCIFYSTHPSVTGRHALFVLTAVAIGAMISSVAWFVWKTFREHRREQQQQQQQQQQRLHPRPSLGVGGGMGRRKETLDQSFSRPHIAEMDGEEQKEEGEDAERKAAPPRMQQMKLIRSWQGRSELGQSLLEQE